MKFLKLGFFTAAISTAIISLNLLRELQYSCTSLRGGLDIFDEECLSDISLAMGSISITLLFLGGAFWNPKKNKE